MTGFKGGIFDVDGVLVDSPHEQAWRDALRAATGKDADKFFESFEIK